MNTTLLQTMWDARRARRAGPDAIADRQRGRLTAIVEHARTNSAVYRELYRALPARVDDFTQLPVVDKPMLMARFEEWVCDPQVTLKQAEAFVEDPDLIGRPILDRYAVSTTSGTTGTPGIFLLDDRALAVASAMAARMFTAWLGPRDLAKIVRARGRMAMTIATGGHFATATAAAQLRSSRRRARTIQAYSVHAPLPELVAALNRFQPAILAIYATIGQLLAGEAEAGRLRIRPALVTLAAEGLPAEEYDRIATAFAAKVGNSWAANECPFLSYSCPQGWLHINSDWVIVEPVDANHQPTPPGKQSHTVLITNLANQVQPILRYDLGDSVLARPDPCPCGNPLPAIQVQGRAADLLTLPGQDGDRISLSPLAITTLAEATTGLEQFQLEQTTPTTLRIRLRTAITADSDRVWQSLHIQLSKLLDDNKLGHVVLERGTETPLQHQGGKHRAIIPLDTGA